MTVYALVIMNVLMASLHLNEVPLFGHALPVGRVTETENLSRHATGIQIIEHSYLAMRLVLLNM